MGDQQDEFVISDRVLNNMRSILDGDNMLPGMDVEGDALRCAADGRLFTYTQFQRFFGPNKFDILDAWKEAEPRTAVHRAKQDDLLAKLCSDKQQLPRRGSELQSPRRDIGRVRDRAVQYFFELIKVNDVEGVRKLLDSGIFGDQPHHMTPGWQTDLPREELKWTTLLLAQDTEGWAALHLTALHASAEVATLLCDRFPWLIDARPDARLRATPLHLAAERDHRDVARVLLKKKAKLHALNAIGETPIEKAKQCGHLRMEQLLVGFAIARWHGRET
ncbi:unnamed protein product [Amoebophrya sp. A120]|nr:unnamed protein product [Amoebophrya sp. A120]|eukprot:GSA120T00015012001.1